MILKKPAFVAVSLYGFVPCNILGDYDKFHHFPLKGSVRYRQANKPNNEDLRKPIPKNKMGNAS